MIVFSLLNQLYHIIISLQLNKCVYLFELLSLVSDVAHRYLVRFTLHSNNVYKISLKESKNQPFELNDMNGR